MRWFEDIELGVEYEIGSYTFEADDIIAFATKYDPQPFHVDEEAAKASHFGGLVASGWHTTAIWMKLMMAYRAPQLEEEVAPAPDGRTAPRGGPSPGFLDLKWLRPVYAGDTITFINRTHKKIDLKSRPYQGIMRSFNRGFNQHGDLVISFYGQGLVERRLPYEPPADD